MHDDLNKRHKMSSRLSGKLHLLFWQEIRTIKAITLLFNETSTVALILTEKITQAQIPTLKLQRAGLGLDFKKTLRDVSQN